MIGIIKVFLKCLISLICVLQFAEGSGERRLPRVPGEVYQRVHPQVSLLWRHSAAAAGAECRSCGDCESGKMTKTCLNPVFCRPSKLSQFRLCWWFSSKSKTFYLPFFPLPSLQGNDPTALSVLTQAITGQVGFMDAEFCTSCGEKGAEKRCSVCKMVSAKNDSSNISI